nr:serine hydrolase [Portibacter marinus]
MKKKLANLLTVLTLLFPLIISAQVHTVEVPKDMPARKAVLSMNPDLAFSLDLSFMLSTEINKRDSWRKLVNNKKMAVGLIDLSDPSNPEYASLNGNHMMYAASLPKIAVLLAAMDAIEEGTLKDTEEVRKDMWLMISKSNNAATTRTIDRVGFGKIASVMEDPRYKFYDREGNGGLWVGKRYAAGGKRVPDPLKGISHAATVDQVLRFYKKLAYGELINPDRSLEMLRIMMNPSLHHKFVNTLDRVNPDAKVFRKSGSWKVYHADSAIVWGEDDRKYILVALIEDPNGGAICRELVNVAEKIILEKADQLAMAKS